MAATKKDGGANNKYWDSNETIEQLENVRTWLVKNSRKVRFNISLFIIKTSLIYFLSDTLKFYY